MAYIKFPSVLVQKFQPACHVANLLQRRQKCRRLPLKALWVAPKPIFASSSFCRGGAQYCDRETLWEMDAHCCTKVSSSRKQEKVAGGRQVTFEWSLRFPITFSGKKIQGARDAVFVLDWEKRGEGLQLRNQTHKKPFFAIT